jgi:glycerophosphoryl diester phosphodiesterase
MSARETGTGPALVMPALLRDEDIAGKLSPELAGCRIVASVGNLPGERECEVGAAGNVVVWNTSDHPDGQYTVRLRLPEGSVDLPFEIVHQLFRESRQRFGRPEIIAHRGGKGYAPENTLAAYLAGVEHGADACEMDVRVTADERLVVMHDDTVDRTTNGSGRIAELTLAQINGLRTSGEPVPVLSEVFEALGERARFQLHVKLEEDEGRNDLLLSRLADLIGRYGYESRCTILATKPRALGILQHNHRLHLDVDIGPGPASATLEQLTAAWFLEGGHRLKTSDFQLPGSSLVREAHEAGIPLVCWARDSSDLSVERLLRLGVDSVMTDHPERMGPIADRLYATAGML